MIGGVPIVPVVAGVAVAAPVIKKILDTPSRTYNREENTVGKEYGATSPRCHPAPIAPPPPPVAITAPNAATTTVAITTVTVDAAASAVDRPPPWIARRAPNHTARLPRFVGARRPHHHPRRRVPQTRGRRRGFSSTTGVSTSISAGTRHRR